jgi:hypothetical protein
MKFVLFNLAVVGALFFLFNPDRADLNALADRAYETVGLAKDSVERLSPPMSKPVRPDSKTPAPMSEIKAPAPSSSPATKPDVPAPEKPVAVKQTNELPKLATAEPAPKLEPAVAKRRAEVLGLDAPQAAGVAVEEKLMSPEQRRRELFTLAEEMELFYVRRLSR